MSASSSTPPQALPPYPPPLPPHQLEELKQHAIDWALANGLVVSAPKEITSQLTHHETSPITTHAPFALFPSPFPRKCFDLAMELQPLFNLLTHKVANDDAFLTEHMER